MNEVFLTSVIGHIPAILRSADFFFCRLLLPLLFIVSCSSAVQAHQSNEAYIELSATKSEEGINAVWLVSMLDLNAVLNLDSSQDGNISWGELTQHNDAIQQYLLEHIQVSGEEGRCELYPATMMMDQRNGVHYVYLPFEIACRPPFKLRYSAMFSADKGHRVLVTYQLPAEAGLLAQSKSEETSASTEVGVITATEPEVSIQGTADIWEAVAVFFVEGVTHILIGYDHILFLMALIIPGVISLTLKHRAKTQHGQRSELMALVKTVTAFTLAHSITLFIAAQHWLSLPPTLIEMAIALTVVIAGINLLANFFDEGCWPLAFAFGLIHGFGFANVLAEMQIPQQDFLASLLAFNLGVEAGQLVILGFVMLLFAGYGKMRLTAGETVTSIERLSGSYGLLQMSAGVCVVAIGSVWTIVRGYEWVISYTIA